MKEFKKPTSIKSKKGKFASFLAGLKGKKKSK
jgi:hypothetical protein